MRVSLFIISILLLLLTSCQSVSAQFKVKKEQLVACETGQGTCKPIDIVRKEAGDKTIVLFLINFDRMRMHLFDATYTKQLTQGDEHAIKPIITDFRKVDNRPAFDLTALPDGRYYVHIIGDEVGGVFELNLKTKS